MNRSDFDYAPVRFEDVEEPEEEDPPRINPTGVLMALGVVAPVYMALLAWWFA